MKLANDIDLLLVYLKMKEFSLKIDRDSLSNFIVARRVYGLKESRQRLVAFCDQNPTNQEREKLHISSHKRARGNINFQRDN